ncbi:MAG: TetR/AcrR family transcriptional regulator [Oscillospiraceae bacterium]|nr:TetR/AcrR family transcriptional regulator [Oscillospiraceae bacterium]
MRKKIDNEIILSAALRVFSRYGYRKATLEDITGELSMTAAGIYAYAESKRELYEQTVSFAMQRWQDRVKCAVAGEKTAVAKFTVLCSSALYYLAEDGDFSSLLKSDPSIFPMFPTVDPYEEINSASVGIIEDILLHGIRSGEFRELDAKTVSEVLFSMYKGFIIHAYVQGESEFIEKNLPQTLDLILRGIEKK